MREQLAGTAVASLHPFVGGSKELVSEQPHTSIYNTVAQYAFDVFDFRWSSVDSERCTVWARYGLAQLQAEMIGRRPFTG